MDAEYPLTEDRKQSLPEIKLEPLEPEGVNLYSSEIEEATSYVKEEIKIEDSGLDSETSQFGCNICSEIFTDEISLNHHVDECHQVDCKPFSTNTICQNDSQICLILRETVYTAEKKFKCPQTECGKLFKRKHDLRDHLYSHSDERLYKCQSSGCKKSFKTKRMLKSHQLVHRDEKLFECPQPQCTSAFKRKDAMLQHMGVHSDEKPFICKQTGCLKSFGRKADLVSHEKVHSEEKPFKCEQPGCTQSFKRKTNLTSHEAIHRDGKVFMCPVSECTSAFKRRDMLQRHMRLHSDEKPFKCEQPGCSETFKGKNELKQHMKLHSDEKPFKCEQPGCNKSFKRRNEFKQHMRVHSDKKPFKCKQPGYLKSLAVIDGRPFRCKQADCTWAFKRKSDLERHIKVHSDEKPFKCELDGCRKTFRTRTKLNQHMKMHEAHDNTSDTKSLTKFYTAKGSSCDGTLLNENKNCRKSFQEGDFQSDPLGINLKAEESTEQDVEKLETVQQCSICEKMFNEENEFKDHIECCGKYSSFEFVEVGQTKPDGITLHVKSEVEYPG